MRLFATANYRFMESRKWAYIFSAAVILLGLASIATRGVIYSVEFTGGTLLQIAFTEPVDAGALRSAFDAAGFSTAVVQNFGGEGEFLVRLPESLEGGGGGGGEGGGGGQAGDRVRATLSERFGGYEIRRTEAIGPKVGAELRQKAASALGIAFLCTLIYLAFRFEWRFGLAAILATLHDTLITLGFISAFGIEVSLPTIAAILTVIGYSLNDTIVIFDRIRENLKKHRRDDYMHLLNRSINETLPRTVLTGTTTLLTLLALLFFGGAVIRDFALVLALGIVIGTFSSIFVASPILLEIQQRSGKVRGQPPKTEKRPTASPV